MSERNPNQNVGAVLLIGFGLLLVTHWWWPGILFVAGIALFVRAANEGRPWMDEHAGVILVGIGSLFVLFDILRFALNFWPLLLIAGGAYLLFSASKQHRFSSHHHGFFDEKSKHNEFV